MSSLLVLLQTTIEEVADEMCNNYCKYPGQWNEEKEGCELAESEYCINCPLNRIN